MAARGGGGSPSPNNKSFSRRWRRRPGNKPARQGEKTMSDMSQYAGSQYWKVIDVRDGPVKLKIEAVSISKFNKPDLVFADGSKFSVNATNAKTLCRSYGKNDSDWIGKEIQLEIGEVEFEGEKISTVIIRPISPATVKSAAPAKAKTAPAQPDYDDEIPF
jgi:hypothetical protein